MLTRHQYVFYYIEVGDECYTSMIVLVSIMIINGWIVSKSTGANQCGLFSHYLALDRFYVKVRSDIKLTLCSDPFYLSTVSNISYKS